MTTARDPAEIDTYLRQHEGTGLLRFFVDAPLAVAESRDPKGLYAKARRGELKNFTGIDSPYEPPEHPDLVLDTARESAEAAADRVVALLRARGLM